MGMNGMRALTVARVAETDALTASTLATSSSPESDILFWQTASIQ